MTPVLLVFIPRLICYDSCMDPFGSTIGDLNERKREGRAVTVGRVEDVPPGRGATIEVLDGLELAIYNVDGHFYAIENFCPHKGAPLANGRLFGTAVECDWHGWRFDLKTGACLTNPGEIETYEVMIEDGWIRVRI